MMIRRIGSQVLVSCNSKEQAKSLFAFLKKRNPEAFHMDGDLIE